MVKLSAVFLIADLALGERRAGGRAAAVGGPSVSFVAVLALVPVFGFIVPQHSTVVRTGGAVVDGGDDGHLVLRAQLVAAGAAPIGHRTVRGADGGGNRVVMLPGMTLRRDDVLFRGGERLSVDGRRGCEELRAVRRMLRVNNHGIGDRRGQGLRIVVPDTVDVHGHDIGIAVRGPRPVRVGGRHVGVAGGAVGRFHPLGGGADIRAAAHRHRGGILRGGVIDAAGGIGFGLDRRRRRDRMVAAVAGEGGGHGPAVAACRPVAPRRRGGIGMRRAGGGGGNVGIGGNVVEGLIPRYRIMVIVVGGLGRQVRGRGGGAVSDILRLADLVAVQVIEFHFIGPGGVGILRGIGRRAGDRRNGGRPVAEGVDALRGLITGLGGGGRGGRLPVFHRGGGAGGALRGGVVPRDLIRARGGRVGSGIGLPRVGIAHHGRAARGNGGRPDGVDIIVLRVGGLRRDGGNGERVAVVRGDRPELRVVLVVERHRAGLFDQVQAFVAVGIGAAGAAEQGDRLLNVDRAVLHRRCRVRIIGIHRVVRDRRHDLREGRPGACDGFFRVHPSVGGDLVIAVQRGGKRGVNGSVVQRVEAGALVGPDRAGAGFLAVLCARPGAVRFRFKFHIIVEIIICIGVFLDITDGVPCEAGGVVFIIIPRFSRQLAGDIPRTEVAVRTSPTGPGIGIVAVQRLRPVLDQVEIISLIAGHVADVVIPDCAVLPLCFQLHREIGIMGAVAHHDDRLRGKKLEFGSLDFHPVIIVGKQSAVRRGSVYKVGITADGHVVIVVRHGVELIRVGRLHKAGRQVGAAVVAGIGIIGVVDHHLLRGHGAAVDAQVLHIAGEIGVAVVVAGAPLVACVPAGTADVVVLITADLVQENIQISSAAFFGVVGAVLYAVDPVGDGAACDPDHHVVDLAAFKRGRARGRRFDVL